MIEIKSVADLMQLTTSIIRKVELQTDPAGLSIAFDGPDELRYVLLIKPSYQVKASPVEITISTGITLHLSQDKQE